MKLKSSYTQWTVQIMISENDIHNAISELDCNPFGYSVNAFDNGDLAVLLKELLEHRENVETIKELIT